MRLLVANTQKTSLMALIAKLMTKLITPEVNLTMGSSLLPPLMANSIHEHEASEVVC